MNDYPYNLGSEVTLTQRVTQVMKRVYVKMFLALLVSTAAAWITSHTELALYMAMHRWVYWGLFIAEIGLVLGITSGISRMKSSTASMLFYLFAIVNGMALSMIFLVYTGDSIFKTFLITAGVFGAMSVYGYTTARDLTQFGTFLRMALFGLIICLVINIFWANNTLEWIISIAGVLIFIGLTAWGHSEDQADGTDDAVVGLRPPRHTRRPEPVSRLHQPVPLPAALLR